MKQTIRQLVDRGAALIGTAGAFLLALILTIAWLVTGSLFALPDGWQIVTSTVGEIAILLVLFVLLFQLWNAQPAEAEESIEEEAAY